MDIDNIIEFLGCEPQQEGIIEPDKLKVFHYKGETLTYDIHVDIEEKTLAISGDLKFPFAGNSLYEVYVNYDRICIETEPQFYGEQKILVCRKDFKNKKDSKVLMVMRWPNNELSVWPSQIGNTNE